MPREAQHIIHNKGLLLQRRSTAHTLPEDDQLASGFTVERAEEEFLLLRVGVGWWVGCRRGRWGAAGKFVVADVEAGPVDRGGRKGESGVGVPEERAYIS